MGLIGRIGLIGLIGFMGLIARTFETVLMPVGFFLKCHAMDSSVSKKAASQGCTLATYR